MLRHRVIQQCARLAFGITQMDFIANVGLNASNDNKEEIKKNNYAKSLSSKSQRENLKILLKG